MNKEAILGFIKKNMLSLLCAVAAILAVGAVFYPLGGQVTELQTQADSAGGSYNELTSLKGKQRALPMSDPSQSSAGTLNGIPNAATIQKGQEANDKWVQFSKQMLQELRDENQKGHDLLVADEFPRPQLDTTYFAFATLYKLVLSTDPTISAIGDPNANPPIPVDSNLQQAHRLNLRNDVLNGGLPPTVEEIKKASDDLHENVYVPQYITKNGVAINKEEIDAKFLEDAATLPLRMKGDSARRHKIYVEHDAFTLSPAIVPGQPPQLPDMWYAQMQLWVQQDLANAIKDENADAHGILDAPVKRLLAMQVPPAPMYVFPPASGSTGGSPGTGGTPASADEKAPIPPIYTVSVTGRYSNGMYDVVPFRLVVDVDAAKVNHFIETLSHQRQITVTSQNLFALDAEAESAKGYLYGSGSTVRLVLDGESLFLRSWTKDLMPDRVKQYLGLMPVPGGATPGQGPTGGPMGFSPMGGPPMGGPPYGGGGPGMGYPPNQR